MVFRSAGKLHQTKETTRTLFHFDTLTEAITPSPAEFPPVRYNDFVAIILYSPEIAQMACRHVTVNGVWIGVVQNTKLQTANLPFGTILRSLHKAGTSASHPIWPIVNMNSEIYINIYIYINHYYISQVGSLRRLLLRARLLCGDEFQKKTEIWLRCDLIPGPLLFVYGG